MFIQVMASAFAALISAGDGDAPAREITPNTTPRLVSVNAPDQLMDAIAAEFYENRLRLSQSRRIEAATADHYLSLTVAERSRFRAYRRDLWDRMSAEEKAALRGAKQPRYFNLLESQKRIFRHIAAQELGAGPPPGDATDAHGEI
ncbi:hypothetical protein [Hyphococcus sp.]|uniref:hypothetical protein n=1 Tax=Hyphococcus sp. TaxID=2038636 RepID=UPI003CCB8BCC